MRRTLFVAMQYLLPKHLLTAIVFRLARVRHVATKNWLISRFVKAFNVDLDDVPRTVPDDFVDFNDFFTRELADGARPIDADPKHLVSPVDGKVSQLGAIDNGTILQAKGHDYTVADLLAVDLDAASDYTSFATIYLAPFNYHRVHMPVDGRLIAAHYVPGDLFSVNETTAERVPRLFARNERLNLHFETSDGRFFLSMVGALNVGSITTPWTGEIRPRAGSLVETISIEPTDVKKGDLLGWFNMGSTVILLGRDLDWASAASSDVRMGEKLASLST
ncbi:MAG: archaetidylserine decarboxylase [Woeseiaceae bacterium]|nr:archaetidylserine decarboxylase [Woeseiaceae bacterium]